MSTHYHIIEEWRVTKMYELMHRLYTEQRMTGDEMRDWANWLHTNLGAVRQTGKFDVNEQGVLTEVN